MFYVIETIFSEAETVVPVIYTMVSTVKAIVFLIETTISGTRRFS
jgi:hypothetical protein